VQSAPFRIWRLRNLVQYALPCVMRFRHLIHWGEGNKGRTCVRNRAYVRIHPARRITVEIVCLFGEIQQTRFNTSRRA
jgi:hypothetical protein